MKKIIYSYSILLFSSLFFTSCLSGEGDVDTEKPVIELFAPEEGELLEVGKAIHFEMEASDNVALGGYDIDIHSAEGHTHSDEPTDEHDHDDDHDHDHDDDPENATRVSFKYKNSWYDIQGMKTAHVHHHEIEIPADAKRGTYHFVVKVLDRAGNQTMVFRKIYIVDEGEGDHVHN